MTNFKHAESILAIRNQTLKTQGIGTGLDTWVENYENLISVAEQELIIAPRKGLESDETFRQLLPYVMVTDKNELGETRYAVYRRTKTVGESRLVGKASIGFGGHVDLADVETYPGYPSVVNLSETLDLASIRELEEEVDFSEGSYYSREPFGLLVDDSDEVGRCHLGLVQRLEIFEGKVHGLRESELEWVGMMTIEELQECDLDFENWSRILIDSGAL